MAYDREKINKILIRSGILLGAIALMMGVAWAVTSAIQTGSPAGDEPLPHSEPEQPAASGEEPADPEGEGTGSQPWDFIGPVQQEGDLIVTPPDYRMIALPENGAVDIAYFDTATFMGDSLTQGLQVYNTLPNAQYCAYRGLNVRHVINGTEVKRADNERVVVMEELVATQPDNVYLLLGANDMNLTDEAFLAYYRQILDMMREQLLEGVGIYIQTLTPVRPDNTANFDMERIRNLNNMLATLALEEDVYFLDLNEVLADEEGYLKEEYASGSDGYHLSPAGYEAWKEYLVTHTAYHPRNPYLPGSPYYKGE